MKNWVTINNRLFELEAIPEEQRDSEWSKEWNSLLDSKIAGILNRNKYEEPKGKKIRETKKEKRG